MLGERLPDTAGCMRRQASKSEATAMRDRLAHGLKRLLLVATAGLLLLPAAASAAAPPIGGLAELPGQLACTSADGSSDAGAGTCQIGRGLAQAESVTVSPDGKFVYVGSYADAATGAAPSLTAFSRDPVTGALTQLSGTAGCYTADGSSVAGPHTCTQVPAMGNGDGRDLAITSDGRFAYLVNSHSISADPSPASIVVFSRDPATGVLTRLPGTAGCVSADGSSQAGPNTCQTLATLAEPFSVTLSSDDRFLYVNDGVNPGSVKRIHVLARDTSTGALSEIQCLAEGPNPPAGCTTARDVGGSDTLVLSPDGLHAYDGDTNAHHALSVFDRDPATGLLSQKGGAAGCLSQTGQDDTGAATCGVARATGYGLVMSPDGHTLYVTAGGDGHTNGGLAILHVNDNGTVSQLSGPAGCITSDGGDVTGGFTCATGRGLDFTYGPAISPDGRTLYVADSGPTQGMAVFSLDPSTGEATQLPGLDGCFTADGGSDGTSGVCTKAPAVENDWIPAVSPDGTSVYLASFGERAVTSFTRETGPTCTAATASAAYRTPVTVTLSCTDHDGQAVTRSILSGPAHGTLAPLVNGTVTYTPVNGYTGPDTFTFGATDGTNKSAPAAVTITVGAPPAPPAQSTPPRPRLTKVGQSHRRWREVKHGGTTFSFTLNQRAKVSFTFTQRGHKHSLGRIAVTAHAGKNKLVFNGNLNRHTKLKPGTYTVTITAGTTTRQLTFTIAR